MPPTNLLQAFLENVTRLGHNPCLRYKAEGHWENISWIEVRDQVREIALGLQTRGVRAGDRVAIISKTRYEWTLCDLAILSIGAVTVPIYPSVTSDQAGFILRNSEARAVFVEGGEQLQKIKSIEKALPQLKDMILMSGQARGGAATLAEIREDGILGDEEEWLRGVQKIKPSQMATIVYTSGTTGPPKGAMVTHANFLAESEAMVRTFDLCERHVALSVLPLAHIFARAVQFWQLRAGYVQAYGQSMETFLLDAQEVRPHFLSAVPRIFEKIHEGIKAKVEAMPFWKRMLLDLPGTRILAQRKIQALFGGRLRFAISGGAPLSKELAEYFFRAGVLIVEGYGLTETTAGVFINTEKAYRFGTVGRSMHRIEKKIGPDGEILVRGPMIFQGYYKDPEKTAEVLSPDGWFRTGDVGGLDRDGFLKITDRKKDIIITAAGKNIAPQNIESLFTSVPYISQVMVNGDRRSYLTALVTLNRPAVEGYLHREKIRLNGGRRLAQHPEVYRLIRRAIEEKNKQLASYETIKRFAILEEEFTQEGGELTPTLKLKRKFIAQEFKDVLNGLYQTP